MWTMLERIARKGIRDALKLCVAAEAVSWGGLETMELYECTIEEAHRILF